MTLPLAPWSTGIYIQGSHHVQLRNGDAANPESSGCNETKRHRSSAHVRRRKHCNIHPAC
ncbi:hypothetical protein PISMIDRAFT_672374 [Pisolithus microcarpus 441]|uniref:Uncharacterized protein n=1 Tax=Pisolithus microcarpus 441 TaxID=765257 RepID=A0A0C9ZK08_9AGAM|nr:hypothetical protein PISMIDRAFT_672374 [Pisolithus microcarpus 441]